MSRCFLHCNDIKLLEFINTSIKLLIFVFDSFGKKCELYEFNRMKIQLLVLVCLLNATASATSSTTIEILLLVSNSSQYNSTESISVVQDALKEVNQRRDILPNITLELSTVVESTVSLQGSCQAAQACCTCTC